MALMTTHMEIVNLSAEPTWQLYDWLPSGLRAETIVFLPDACPPGNVPLPIGVAVRTRQPDWRRFAVSDCGCGMRLLRSRLKVEDLTASAWDVMADAIRENKGRLGDLGGGNHFLDALASYGDDRLHLLIHTGSLAESGLVDALVDRPDAFDAEFERVVQWAAANRTAIHAAAERLFGPLELLIDLPHNTFELLPDGGAVVRKSAVRVKPGQLNVIPSHIAGDVALVRATSQVSEALFSLSHGTGRAMSRAECKSLADSYDFAALRDRILIPSGVQDASLRASAPFAYRDLDSCLAMLDGYVEEVERFKVVGYIGHL